MDDYAKEKNIKPFKLNLDDNFLSDYAIVELILNNKGIGIKDSIRFSISINKELTKIIGIQYKVIKPKNRMIRMTDSIPNLEWNPPNKTDLAMIDLEWTSNRVNEENYCYNIYGSFYREKGFGKINCEVIQKNKYNWTIDDLFNYGDRHYFIKIEAVDESCQYIESQSEPMA